MVAGAAATAGAAAGGDSIGPQRLDEQSVKLLAGVAVDPADVRTTTRAHRDLPSPSREIRPSTLGRAEMNASRSRGETTDVMDEPIRVDERVLVASGHFFSMILVGDD